MKKALIAISILIGSCTNPSHTKDILTNEGYTDIVLTGYEPFMCSERDTYSTGFCATNMNGKRVCGAVCGGIGKGYTIRFN